MKFNQFNPKCSKALIKKLFSPAVRLTIRRGTKVLFYWVEERFLSTKAFFGGGNLEELGKFYKSDKVSGHSYAEPYMSHFNKYRKKKIKLLEIGVGGYDNPQVGGHSLRMWKKYFPFGKIFSIDIYDKASLQENRIKIFKGSQVDATFLEEVIKETGKLDIIIDDGSHLNEHVIASFKLLFPVLKVGGIYVVEDTQTSYWETFGGSSRDLNAPGTMMNFFKGLTDGLNNKEFLLPGYKPCYYDLNITSIHFYHNLIFIYKGNNLQESNLVLQNQQIK